MGQLICALHRPGMTALHRVGLAGLYMTLAAFERDQAAKAELTHAGLCWTLEDQRVTLDFGDKPQAALGKFIALSFQLDGEGFFKLPGLERGAPLTLEQKWLLYHALLGTFLQLGRFRPTGTKGTLVIDVDDKQIRISDFAPVTTYKHQDASKPKIDKKGEIKAGDFVDKNGLLKTTIEVKSWLYPGGMKRHEAHEETVFEEPTELAFCLLFAPVGSIFFQINSRRSGRKTRTALVLPSFAKLPDYARLHRVLTSKGVLALTAASPTDAALQLAVQARGQELAQGFDDTIRVLAFGIVDWNEKQKSRTSARTITPAQLPGLANYERADIIFKNRWQIIKAKFNRKGQITEPEHAFVRPCTAREIIADNLANRRPWHDRFTEYVSKKDTRISLSFERKELFQMTQEADYEHPRERTFIATCHEAWRRRLGQLGERSRREHASFNRLASGEYEKLRVALARCKNAASLRATLTDFWSRAGSLPSLRTGWSELLPLLDEAHWRKARDLALLALASYQPANDDEEIALTETSTDSEGN